MGRGLYQGTEVVVGKGGCLRQREGTACDQRMIKWSAEIMQLYGSTLVCSCQLQGGIGGRRGVAVTA